MCESCKEALDMLTEARSPRMGLFTFRSILHSCEHIYDTEKRISRCV